MSYNLKLGMFVLNPVAIPRAPLIKNSGTIGSINFGSIYSPSSLMLYMKSASSSLLKNFFR